MPRLPPLGDISNEISNETQMKAKWATLKNPNAGMLSIGQMPSDVSEDKLKCPSV